MRPWNLPSTFMNFLCIRKTFLKLSTLPKDFPSTCRVSVGTSVNFLHAFCRTFSQLQLTFRASVETSFNFCQLSMLLPDLPTTFLVAVAPFVNISQISVRPRDIPQISLRSGDLPSTFPLATDPPSASIIFTCGHETFHKISLQPRDLLSTSVNFPCIRGTFRHLVVRPQDILSTFRASVGPSVNFHQLFVHLPGYSVNLSYF